MESRDSLFPFNKAIQDLGHFNEATRPAMEEQERDSPGGGALLVYVMDLIGPEAIDVNESGELGKGVELRLCFPPVEAMLPYAGEALDLGDRRTPVPRILYLCSMGKV
jgi:hypothetical protein